MRRLLLAGLIVFVTACGSVKQFTRTPGTGVTGPIENPVTPSRQDLLDLPPPRHKVPIAVYQFADQTGQFKPSPNVQNFSRAVTQGGTAILIRALQDAGNRKWFTVIERENLDHIFLTRDLRGARCR